MVYGSKCESKTKTAIIVSLIFILIGLGSGVSVTVFCEQSSIENNTVNNLCNKQYLNLKGISMIKDEAFKNQLLYFLDLDSELKYEELYYYYSTNFLKNYF